MINFFKNLFKKEENKNNKKKNKHSKSRLERT